jgi:hypothetical protein
MVSVIRQLTCVVVRNVIRLVGQLHFSLGTRLGTHTNAMPYSLLNPVNHPLDTVGIRLRRQAFPYLFRNPIDDSLGSAFTISRFH